LAAELIGLTNICKEFQCLPGSGSLYDQDAFLMWGIGLVVSAMKDREADEQARNNSGRHARR